MKGFFFTDDKVRLNLEEKNGVATWGRQKVCEEERFTHLKADQIERKTGDSFNSALVSHWRKKHASHCVFLFIFGQNVMRFDASIALSAQNHVNVWLTLQRCVEHASAFNAIESILFLIRTMLRWTREIYHLPWSHYGGNNIIILTDSWFVLTVWCVIYLGSVASEKNRFRMCIECNVESSNALGGVPNDPALKSSLNRHLFWKIEISNGIFVLIFLQRIPSKTFFVKPTRIALLNLTFIRFAHFNFDFNFSSISIPVQFQFQFNFNSSSIKLRFFECKKQMC